jgi:hypothetical protein
MSNYRDQLSWEHSSGQRVLVLQCNKSERKSLVRHHKEDGSTKWLSDRVASQHPDGTPKHLHIAIPSEGIYEVVGQPKLTGLYCVYTGTNGLLYHSSISSQEKVQLFAQKNAGVSYKQTLQSLNKKNIF